ncbi:MAG: hypothetical protein ABIR55_07780 [Burkholderiaceae bacterium]
MASIEQRIRRLEEFKAKTIARTLTDVELAVRLARLQPDTPIYEAAWAIINRRVNAQNPLTLGHN